MHIERRSWVLVENFSGVDDFELTSIATETIRVRNDHNYFSTPR